MPKLLVILSIGAILILPACSALPALPGVHRIDIQQGNILTQEMVDKLEPGMDKSQVRFVLGSPPLVDAFHQERWDYIYSIQPGGKDREQRRITLFFEDDRLARMEGDITPSAGGQEESVESDDAAEEATVSVPQIEKKRGFFGGLKNAVGLGGEEEFAPLPSSAIEDDVSDETELDDDDSISEPIDTLGEPADPATAPPP